MSSARTSTPSNTSSSAAGGGDCERRARRIYDADLAPDGGVIHIAAVWLDPRGPERVIAINEASPASASDRFVLGLVRARADAVVTTGRNLRLEPELDHRLGPDSRSDAELAAWRRAHLGREALPRSAVLSSGRELPFDHPLFRRAAAAGAPAPLVFTGEDAAQRLKDRGRSAGVELVGRPRPSLRDCLAQLRECWGASTVVVEAGATTARELYEDPLAVDELLLSVFEEPELVERCQGPVFVSADRIRDAFGAPLSRYESLEASGRWSFLRYRR